MSINNLQGQLQDCSSEGIKCREHAMAISGEGFFPIIYKNNIYFTRIGNFNGNSLTLGKNFYLATWDAGEEKDFKERYADGQDTQLIKLDGINSLTTLKPVKYSHGGAKPTTKVKFHFNLDAREEINQEYDSENNQLMINKKASPHFSQFYDIFDTEGMTHRLISDFVHIGTNIWAVETYPQISSDIIESSGTEIIKEGDKEKILIRKNILYFDDKGELISIYGNYENKVSITWKGGQTNELSFLYGCAPNYSECLEYNNQGKCADEDSYLYICGPEFRKGFYGHITNIKKFYTQAYNPKLKYSIENDKNVVTIDGKSFSKFSHYNFTNKGEILAVFHNGEQQHVNTLALAKFDNPLQELKKFKKHVYSIKSTNHLPSLYKVSNDEVGKIYYGKQEEIKMLPLGESQLIEYEGDELDIFETYEDNYKTFNDYTESLISTQNGVKDIAVRGSGFLPITCELNPKKIFFVKSFSSIKEEKYVNKDNCYLLAAPIIQSNKIELEDLQVIEREYLRATKNIYIGKQLLNSNEVVKGAKEYNYKNNNLNMSSGKVITQAKPLVIDIVDSQGFQNNIKLGFVKTKDDKKNGYHEWDVEIYAKVDEQNNKQLAHGKIQFNQKSPENNSTPGSVKEISPNLKNINIEWSHNNNTQLINIDWGPDGDDLKPNKFITGDDNWSGIRELPEASKAFWGLDPIRHDGVTPDMKPTINISPNGIVAMKYINPKSTSEITEEKFWIMLADVASEDNLIIMEGEPGFSIREDMDKAILLQPGLNDMGIIVTGMSTNLNYNEDEI